jgi:DNA-binding beta-propeller fold protein YncE
MIRRLSFSFFLLALVLSRPTAAQTFTVSRFSIGGDGGTDYLTAEPGTGRIFVSRSTHVMVLDGGTGRVLGDIPDTPRTHGIALAPRWHHGFTTNAGDSTLTVFDLTTLAPVAKVRVPIGGLDGIMYDSVSDRIVLTTHSRPSGTATLVDPAHDSVGGAAVLEDDSPEGAAVNGRGTLYVNNEGTSTIQVIDVDSMAVRASWPLAPCEGPTGLAYDPASQRLFVGCDSTSVVIDPATGKVVATIPNGAGVDAIGWDPTERLLYIPAGRDSTVTIAHQDTPDQYHVVATVTTMRGAKTISVDPLTHVAYLFQPEYGPAPAPAPGTPPPAPGSRPPRGPVIGAYLFAIHH